LLVLRDLQRWLEGHDFGVSELEESLLEPFDYAAYERLGSHSDGESSRHNPELGIMAQGVHGHWLGDFRLLARFGQNLLHAARSEVLSLACARK